MAVAAALAWYEECREAEYLEESIHKRLNSISKRLMAAKDLSEAEVAKLKEEHVLLRKQTVQFVSRKPDFSGMTEAERAETAERLRNDELHHAHRLLQESNPSGVAMEALARIVDFDPKQGGLYYTRYTRSLQHQFDLDEESHIGPMRFIDSPYKSEEDYSWLCTAVNFLSVQIASSDVGFPMRVYGTIIVRDNVDNWKCVYHLSRDSDNCQLINSEDEALILTGPKRGLALCSDIFVEIDLKMKDDLVQDRELSKGVISIRGVSTVPTVSGYRFQTKSLATRLSTVDVNYTVVYSALEGTIAVEVLQGGFHGKIAAYTANMKYMLVLYNSKEDDAMTVDDCGVLELMRPVVSVCVNDLLVIEALTSDESARIMFSPRINARDEHTLSVGATKLRVKLCCKCVVVGDQQAYLRLSHNFSGAIPTGFAAVGFAHHLDLSRNAFTGDASGVFGKGKPLQHLDLSRNGFAFSLTAVELPEQLSYVDLSHNAIRGRILSQVADLAGLQVFNVSYNKMCGVVPTGGNMARFDAYSYQHNKCLCGTPMPSCGGHRFY